MSWEAWKAEVLRIAESRGIAVSVTPGAFPNSVRYEWSCRNGSNRGSAGADPGLAQITSPLDFTYLWICSLAPPSPTQVNDTRIGVAPVNDSSSGLRAGRFVPRLPAMVISEAFGELTK